jgi:diguanylate cyclase (GGDEF)-like protein/PAS domain S-box-containing protein
MPTFLAGPAAPSLPTAPDLEPPVLLRSVSAQPATAVREQALLALLPEAVLVIDEHGVITYASPGCLRILGHEPAQLEGQHLAGLIHPEDRRDVMTAGELLLTRQGQAHLTCRARRGDGAWTWVQAQGVDERQHPDVRGMIITLRVMADRIDVNAVEHLAFHDHLTGLATRHLLRDRLGMAVARSHRYGSPYALLALDLEGFHHVNDLYGYDLADEVLRVVGARLRSAVRETDTPARIGGDEFAVLLPTLDDVEDARAIAERVLHVVRHPIRVGGMEVTLDAFLGLAVSTTDVNTSIDEGTDALLRDADAALHRARSAPPGTPVVFQPDMRRESLARIELTEGLRRALDEDQFVLHYQPIVRLSDGIITGVEALLRWRHPRRGIIPPNDFIPVAEDTGLIVPIGAWALAEACRQTVTWHHRFPSDARLNMAVNVSPVQLASGRLATDVGAALTSSGLPPDALTLEITESALLTDLAEAAEVLTDLKRLGVQIAPASALRRRPARRAGRC